MDTRPDTRRRPGRRRPRHGGHMADKVWDAAKPDSGRAQGGHKADTWRTHGGHMADKVWRPCPRQTQGRTYGGQSLEALSKWIEGKQKLDI